MMTSERHDPLLLGAKTLIWLFIGVLGFALIFVGIGIPAAAIFQGQILAEAAAKGVDVGPELIGAILIALISVFALLAAATYFLVLLNRIVDSVKQGDPFIAINAARLSRMGWLTLASQAIIIPISAVALWIDTMFGHIEGVGINADIDFSLEGLLLALVLFILARVFKHGAAMREDLEGTV